MGAGVEETVGPGDGADVGAGVGTGDGTGVGDAVGTGVGARVDDASSMIVQIPQLEGHFVEILTSLQYSSRVFSCFALLSQRHFLVFPLLMLNVKFVSSAQHIFLQV